MNCYNINITFFYGVLVNPNTGNIWLGIVLSSSWAIILVVIGFRFGIIAVFFVLPMYVVRLWYVVTLCFKYEWINRHLSGPKYVQIVCSITFRACLHCAIVLPFM